MLDAIEKPVLVLDVNRCKRNISRMVLRAAENECDFRPHFKTHQSRTVGRWFRDAGISGITVSTPQMAQYFAEDGWDDITIAFPFHPSQLKSLQELEKRCNLQLFVNSAEHLELLDRHLQNSFKWYIEVDPGYGRSGIHYENRDLMAELIERSDSLKGSHFEGFYIHDGRTYGARGKQEIIEIITPVISILKDLKQEFPFGKISLGDTPSASCLDNFDGIDILTPGNLVFYDWMQVQIGSCGLDDVAVFALLPVAQHIKNEQRAILHGGAVHLSKDFVQTNGKSNYGQVIQFSEDDSIRAAKNVFINKLSQEHGILHYPAGEHSHFENQSVWVCPVHSCLTANLFDHYITTDGKKIEKRILS